MPPEDNVAILSEHRNSKGAGGGRSGSGELVLDPRAPYAIAKKFLDARCLGPTGKRVLHHHQDVFYRWNGIVYKPVPECALKTQLYA